MAAILSFTPMMYAPGIDLDIELGQVWDSQDVRLKQQPQGEKTMVFNPNTTPRVTLYRETTERRKAEQLSFSSY